MPWLEPDVYFGGRKSGPPSRGNGGDRIGERKATDLDLSVLIVDDVEDTRLLYQRFFEWNGARVEIAADGRTALQQVLRVCPDVIVLDLAMPRVTGWEVLQSLKADARTAHIPVIVVSGQDARTSATLAGAESYFEKPCLPDTLLREVRRVYAQSRRRRD